MLLFAHGCVSRQVGSFPPFVRLHKIQHTLKPGLSIEVAGAQGRGARLCVC